MFQPKSLQLARESRGKTQGDLAESLGLPQSRISKFEAGLAEPSAVELDAVARELNYSVTLFHEPTAVSGPGMPEWYHRSLKSASVRAVKTLHARCAIMESQIRAVLRSSNAHHTSRIPRWTASEGIAKTPIEAAQLLRCALGVPSGPILNLVEVLEAAGAIVIDMDFGLDKVDALCRWVGDLPPIFFLNTRKPACRTRFNLAHELAHSVLHHSEIIELEEAEREANEFAAEFLCPAREVKMEFPPVVGLPDLGRLKSRWRVSMACLLRRAKDTGRVDDRRYRYLTIDMSRRGWNKVEPANLDVPREQPRAFYDLARRHLSELGYSRSELARLMFVTEEELRFAIETAPVLGDDQEPALRLSQ